MILPEDENFLLVFRREAPLDNSVDFMKVSSEVEKDGTPVSTFLKKEFLFF